jgi:peptidoglycan/LPS O-acetylase OafA/YrhL
MGTLRLLLAISVVLFHSEPIFGTSLIPGPIAVRIFFAISGFYMALILDSKYRNVALFWSNRFLRLYPAYLIFIILSLAWFGFTWIWLLKMPTNNFVSGYEHMHLWQSAALLVSNFTMFGIDLFSLFDYVPGTGFIFPGSLSDEFWLGQLRIIGQAWSSGVELWFYLLAPWLVNIRNARLVLICGVSIAIAVAVQYLISFDIAYFMFPTNLYFFVFGILMYRAMPLYTRVPAALRKFAMIALVLFIACWQLCGFGDRGWIAYGIVIPLVPLLFIETRNRSWDNALGNLSYPIYVSHGLVITVLQNMLHNRNGYLICASTILVSALTYRFIEAPIDRYRQARVKTGVWKASEIPLAKAAPAS